ncbi:MULTISPECIES: hypothetical protein [unclassified Anaerobiospirillum]|uniref:hypothetical protein n=1 Tax=unclassified Anaerobiospirillum TaxID=2647410 RepID=UPI001FF4DC76|nr:MULTISPECIES: hypothetical protein [unclassified Anaerobiospirillum]MCK0533997.1 hypothetical protein [Anaerobiospirillum sp. NML120511]MCK0539260.1 hypothetical protein [Anaerobiospirillum sp. NML02-A-032]
MFKANKVTGGLKLTALAISASLLLSACASTPEECDPSQDQGFFGKMGCIASGSYGKRIEAKEKKVEELKAEAAQLNQLAREIHEMDRKLMGSYSERTAVLDKARSDLYNIESRLASKKALSADLQDKLANARDQIMKMNTPSAAEQTIAQKQKQIKELEAQLSELEAAMVQ